MIFFFTSGPGNLATRAKCYIQQLVNNLSLLILREENRFSRLSVYLSSNVFSQDLSKIQTSSYMYRMPISTKLCRIVPLCRSNDIKLIPLDRRIDVYLPGDCSRRRNCTTSIYQAGTRQKKSEKQHSSNLAVEPRYEISNNLTF